MKERPSKQQESTESESERSSSPSKPSCHAKTGSQQQQANDAESGRCKSAPKLRKQSIVNSTIDSTNTSHRSRSTSPIKTNGNSKLLDHRGSKPKTNLSNTEKKFNKYEMIPSGSLRKNRSSLNAPSNHRSNHAIPTQSDVSNQKITSSTHNTLPSSSQRHDSRQMTNDARVNDAISPSKQPSLRLEKNAVTLKRAQSLERLEHGCDNISDHKTKVDSTQRMNPIPPCKSRSFRSQSSFTENKKTSKKLDESLLSLTHCVRKVEPETESTIPICEKPRHAITPPVPHREYSSHSSSTTLPSPISTISSSSGSVPSYKNTVEVKNTKHTNVYDKKGSVNKVKECQNVEGGTKHALDDIMKSRRFRNSNLELQKKTKQYLVAVQTVTSSSKVKAQTKTWR
jgi:hypothetical protein